MCYIASDLPDLLWWWNISVMREMKKIQWLWLYSEKIIQSSKQRSEEFSSQKHSSKTNIVRVNKEYKSPTESLNEDCILVSNPWRWISHLSTHLARFCLLGPFKTFACINFPESYKLEKKISLKSSQSNKSWWSSSFFLTDPKACHF